MPEPVPGLDPARVEAAAAASEPVWLDPHNHEHCCRIAALNLAADDARARDAGLVCQGDGLTREALEGLVAVARHAVEYSTHAQVRGWAQMALRTLPSSLLDETGEGS